MHPFTPSTLEFLGQAPFEVKRWLAANRSRCEEHVLRPQKDLTAALSLFMQGVDPGLEGTASRIYRDMRFQRGGPAFQLMGDAYKKSRSGHLPERLRRRDREDHRSGVPAHRT